MKIIILKNYIKGASLVEALLAIATFVLIITAVVGAIIYGQESTATAGARDRANNIAEEGIEAVRNIRDGGYNLLTDGSYGLDISTGRWLLSGANNLIDGFTRQIIIETIDARTKKITSNVSWQQTPSRLGQLTLETYLTNWLDTTAVARSWATVGRDSGIDFSGLQDGLKVQVQGNYAYIVRNDGTPDFIIVDFTNTLSPSIVGSLALTGAPTNIFVLGDYAYISNRDNAQELQIINITNKTAPTQIGSYDAAGTGDALGIYVVSNTAYLTKVSQTGADLFLINITNPASPTTIGSLDLGATGNEIYVSGNYAFVASSHNNQELQIINITNPSAPVIASSLNLPGNTDAITISGTGNYVFLGQGNPMRIIDISTPTNPILLGSYNAPGSIQDIALSFADNGNILFLGNSSNNNEFEAINITDKTNPVQLGSYDVSGNQIIFGVAYDSIQDKVFVVGNLDTEEFTILTSQ